jgi:hypothetical protein
MAGAKGLPDSFVGLLAAADSRNGLPPGTMYSVMRQEIGGNDKYLKDPAAYHYELNADGKRIAGHTGKVSTAFGPFGILESTGAKPGYGVAPLKDKSIEEQVRFASDYLAARSKSAGGLPAGLAGYGEGEKYANQVVNRMGGKAPAPAVLQGAAPVMLAAAAPEGQRTVSDQAQGIAPTPVSAPAQVAQADAAMNTVAAPPTEDPWAAFQAQQRQAAPVQVTDLGFGHPTPINVPDFMAALSKAPEQQAAWAAPAKTGSKYSALMRSLIG